MDAYIEHGNSAEGELPRLGRCMDRMHSLAAAQIFSHMAGSMRSGDISFSQINVLFWLYGHGPQRIADLAQATRLSHCAMSRLVSRLESDGLASKQENAANRRERLIGLTPGGLDFLRDLQRNTAAAYENVFTGVPPELRGELLAVLERLLPLLPRPEYLVGALNRR
ncbi:MAG: hypothetical protein AUJ49_09590 [Desulfovibrionaceae bacterium CG1_02_65_16]|nr:MAG: hypothetical protein AUJ49_09590 [Desulfovibrionaceae bacterium CG1_02_65_16]